MLLTKCLLVVELLCAGTICAWHDTESGVTVPVPPRIRDAADLWNAEGGVEAILKACAAQDREREFILDPVSNRRVRNGCYGKLRP